MRTNVLSYLEETARRYPQKTAFSFQKETISFAELLMRAKALGGGIAALVPPRTPVAVYMEKQVDAVVAFMGIVYAGCFYCFLDKGMPEVWKETMLDTLQPGLILINDDLEKEAEVLPGRYAKRRIRELEQEETDEQVLFRIRRKSTDMDALCCNFTVDSKGELKGVLVAHRSVIDFVDAFTELFYMTGKDVIVCRDSFDPDMSVKDLYVGIAVGAEVVLLSQSVDDSLPELLNLLEERRVTTLIWEVSALCALSAADGLRYGRPSWIRKILFFGDVMPTVHLTYWQHGYPEAMFVNLYGSTEVTGGCVYHIIGREYREMECIPIGVPFPNGRILLLDGKNCEVTDAWKKGELCVTGSTLALGYYRDPGRTGEVFVQNPLNDRYPERIYRSGDFGCYGEDGLLYFIGRMEKEILR